MTEVTAKHVDISKQCGDLSVHSQDVSTSNGISVNDDNVIHTSADVDNGSSNRGNEPEDNKETLSAYNNELHPVEYYILDEKTVISYSCSTVTMWENFADGSHIDATSIVNAREVGDGNLNLVFILYNENGSSVAVVKQALPYVRCVGTSWPMSITRNHMEAITLQAHYKYCPEYTEKMLFHDPVMGVMVLEDLSAYTIWRRELCQCRFHRYVASQLATYLAQVHFHTSDFYATSDVKKYAVQQLTNVELCENTETLFFTEPYIISQRNNYEDELQNVIKHYLRDDASLRLCVAHLKQSFMTHTEAHLHGDIHTGSVFVNGDSIKVIDAEFGFYGPLGFDIGNVIGSLLLNYVALPSLLRQRESAPTVDEIGNSNVAIADRTTTASKSVTIECTTQDLLLSSIVEFWNAYAKFFTSLASAKTRDVTFGFDGYCKAFLRHVWTESIGYTGTELIRRTVGLSHVIDVDGIADRANRVSVKETCIKLGCYLIKHASEFDSPEDLVRAITDKKQL